MLGINTNISGLSASRSLRQSQESAASAARRLSSGLRVNSAADDASGLAISTRMESSVRGLDVARRNSQDGVSFAQMADGALSGIVDALQRMRELWVQGQNSSTDKASLLPEYGQLQEEIRRLAASGAVFNGINALGAAGAAGVALQIGESAGDAITLKGADLSPTGGSTIAWIADPASGLQPGSFFTGWAIDMALQQASRLRSRMGAIQARLEGVAKAIDDRKSSQMAARSRIMDADYAAETANLAKSKILADAGTAMVAQANQRAAMVLRLLGA